MKNNAHGFTLLELMIAIVLAGIVSGVIYSAYRVQTNVYQEQDDVVQMQQNIRSALAFMLAEARMAGFNRSGETMDDSCGATPGAGAAMAPGVHTATSNTFGFSMDLDNDGDCDSEGENVLYQLYTTNGVQRLGRDDLTDNQAQQSQQSIADNVDALEFVYLFQPPRRGSPVNNPPTSTPAAGGRLEDIRTVQVSLLVRAQAAAGQAAMPTAYALPRPDAWGDVHAAGGTEVNVADDHVRRRLLTTMINLRNMGL